MGCACVFAISCCVVRIHALLPQSINFYSLSPDVTLVDMPGYGFAMAKIADINSWAELVCNSYFVEKYCFALILTQLPQNMKYLQTRKALKRIFILIGESKLCGVGIFPFFFNFY